VASTRPPQPFLSGRCHRPFHESAEERHGIAPGFTKRHNVILLVYFEAFEDIDAAIAREKQLKDGTAPGR
jgi:predicted GIY-YIG superfamily endonuclease